MQDGKLRSRERGGLRWKAWRAQWRAIRTMWRTTMAVRQFDKARKRNRKHEQDLDKLDERLARLDHTVARISRKLKGQQDLQEMTIRTVVLPRIASAMYKEIFRIGSGREHWEPRLTDERRSQLLARHDQFADFGMRSVEEMRVFVATWPRIVPQRDTMAYSLCGDDVVVVLPFATPDVARVLERGFELIFGSHPVD